MTVYPWVKTSETEMTHLCVAIEPWFRGICFQKLNTVFMTMFSLLYNHLKLRILFPSLWIQHTVCCLSLSKASYSSINVYIVYQLIPVRTKLLMLFLHKLSFKKTGHRRSHMTQHPMHSRHLPPKSLSRSTVAMSPDLTRKQFAVGYIFVYLKATECLKLTACICACCE